jgi:membrane-bound lytic murein transglycosylase MltF
VILENNIHAGAKYMRCIQDRYFDDASINAEDKMMFTFAAYNAGPGRVAKLRKEAAEMRLNPDTWFHNVEIVAAKRIGRETVQYVSIYFYILDCIPTRPGKSTLVEAPPV